MDEHETDDTEGNRPSEALPRGDRGRRHGGRVRRARRLSPAGTEEDDTEGKG